MTASLQFAHSWAENAEAFHAGTTADRQENEASYPIHSP
jgi:hypothetical protein